MSLKKAGPILTGVTQIALVGHVVLFGFGVGL